QVGWMPYLIERADQLWEERSDNSFGTNGIRLGAPPSTYVTRQVYGCVFNDASGLEQRQRVGMSQICFEVDYPHADGTFPATERVAAELCRAASLSEQETYQLLRGNAIELFGLARFGVER